MDTHNFFIFLSFFFNICIARWIFCPALGGSRLSSTIKSKETSAITTAMQDMNKTPDMCPLMKEKSGLGLSHYGLADDGTPCRSRSVDILEEGQHYLGISMLV